MATRKLLALTCVLASVTACTAPVEILKEVPANGTVRRGDVVFVDDGKCPAGEVKRIVGGNQMTGAPRQVECVKRPETR